MPVPILLLIKQEKTHKCEEGKAHLRISFWYLFLDLKNNYLLRKLLKWAYKNKTIIIFIMLHCFFKKRKTPGYIIILHVELWFLDTD